MPLHVAVPGAIGVARGIDDDFDRFSGGQTIEDPRIVLLQEIAHRKILGRLVSAVAVEHRPGLGDRAVHYFRLVSAKRQSPPPVSSRGPDPHAAPGPNPAFAPPAPRH